MIPPIRRVVWLTETQRLVLLEQCEKATSRNNTPLLGEALEQIRTAHRRERITGRLVRGHVTGLRLPHDAIPVRLTDEEAALLCQELELNDTLRRLLDPTW